MVRSNKTDGLILTKPKENLSGKVFGKLTVLRQGPDLILGGSRRAAWYCKCSCGNKEELLILGDSLKSGHTKSCGCIMKDNHQANNTYDLTGEHGTCKMADGNIFIFDLEDYEKIKDYTWHLSGREYIGTSIDDVIDGKKKRRTMMIHRLIMGIQDKDWKECVVDHINGNVFDNRKSNLRVVTQQKNMMNQKSPKSNKSGVPGVSYYKKNRKWGVSIKVKGESIFIGLYENFEDAVKARKEAEEKYFGEYSYDNSRKISPVKEI